MNDRLVAGGIAGMVGAAVQNLYSYLVRWLNLTDYTYSDFATTVLTNRVYSDPIGIISGFMAYLSVGVILGVLFAYLVSSTASDFLYLKALFYGFVLWFILTGFGTIFGLPTFQNMSPISALSILFGGFIFSVVTAFTIKILDKRTALL